MGLVDVDPLAVLPVTAASASAAFARASDPAGDEVVRREHLAILQVTLTAARRLLDGCDRAAARVAEELDGRPRAELCRGATCQAAGAVVVRDLTGAEQALCVSHAAVAVQKVDQLVVVAASRHSRALLAELANTGCIVGRRVRRLAEAEGRWRDG